MPPSSASTTCCATQVRTSAGRAAAPSAAIIDSQSVRAADTVPSSSRGYDAGKKVNGRKRHLAVDTRGLLLVVLVTAASVQDRDAARALLWRLRAGFRGIRWCWADAGYAGKLVVWARVVLLLPDVAESFTDRLGMGRSLNAVIIAQDHQRSSVGAGDSEPMRRG